MKILLINSNSDSAFVALSSKDETIVSYASDFTDESNKHQSDSLIRCLHKIRQTKNFSFDAVSVITGPGAFTGVRVGLSIAKGAAMASNKKIISVNNFELELNKLKDIAEQKTYCVLIPAKLPEYYYSLNSNGTETEQGCVIIDEIQNKFSKDAILVGNFSDETQRKLNYFETINTANLKNDLDSMIELSVNKFNNGDLFDGAETLPMYVKDFVFIKL